MLGGTDANWEHDWTGLGALGRVEVELSGATRLRLKWMDYGLKRKLEMVIRERLQWRHLTPLRPISAGGAARERVFPNRACGATRA